MFDIVVGMHIRFFVSGVVRYISVVMADRTVSSFELMRRKTSQGLNGSLN